MKKKTTLLIKITSPYEWGKGWTLSMEALDEFNEHLSTIIDKIGHEKVLNSWGVPEGKNETEESYFHPMELAITFPENVSKERIKEVINIVQSNLSSNYPIIFKRAFIKNETGGGDSTTIEL